jgi:plastocyanin
MYGSNGMKIFSLDIILTLILTAGGVIIISASAQQQQNSTSNQTMKVVSRGNMAASGEKNIAEIKTPVTNVKNVSIVPDAAELEDKAYDPNPVEIKVNETIIWTNNDLTTHTVTEGNPSTTVPTNGFDSGLLSPDQSYEHVFEKAGTVEYHCILHPTMIGKVIVS